MEQAGTNQKTSVPPVSYLDHCHLQTKSKDGTNGTKKMMVVEKNRFPYFGEIQPVDFRSLGPSEILPWQKTESFN